VFFFFLFASSRPLAAWRGQAHEHFDLADQVKDCIFEETLDPKIESEPKIFQEEMCP
ncbi:hypothetical protein ILYODFUR_020277, partial [Ilyodon furcidens]